MPTSSSCQGRDPLIISCLQKQLGDLYSVVYTLTMLLDFSIPAEEKQWIQRNISSILAVGYPRKGFCCWRCNSSVVLFRETHPHRKWVWPVTFWAWHSRNGRRFGSLNRQERSQYKHHPWPLRVIKRSLLKLCTLCCVHYQKPTKMYEVHSLCFLVLLLSQKKPDNLFIYHL